MVASGSVFAVLSVKAAEAFKKWRAPISMDVMTAFCAGNEQPWEVVVIRDREIISQVKG